MQAVSFDPLPWVVEWLEETNARLPAHLHYSPTDVLYLVAKEHDLGHSEAWEAVFGALPHKGRTWREFVDYLRQQGCGIPEIVAAVRCSYDGQNESTIRRYLDESGTYKEAHRRAGREYWRRVQADTDKHGARKAAMLDYYYRHREAIRKQQNEYKRRKRDSS